MTMVELEQRWKYLVLQAAEIKIDVLPLH